MAKIVKSTRDMLDVNEELAKVTNSSENKEKSKKEKKEKATTEEKKEGFFKGVVSEMSKVKWLSKKDMVKYSVATVLFILFFAVLFYGINLLMAYLKAMV